MAKYAIKSEFRTSNMADRSEMQSKVLFGHPKWPPKKTIKFCIDLKWPELLSKVNFRHPKWPIDLKCPFCQKFPQKNKVAYQSEMARNAIESEFRTSKIADGSHLVKIAKQFKLRIDLKWPEM